MGWCFLSLLRIHLLVWGPGVLIYPQSALWAVGIPARESAVTPVVSAPNPVAWE